MSGEGVVRKGQPIVLYARQALLGSAPDMRPAAAELRVENGVFQQVRELQPGERPEGPHEDLGERLAVPAFINGHTHLALAALRSLGELPTLRQSFRHNVVEELFFRLEPSFTAEDIAAFVRVGARECLLTGQALVWDHYYHPEAVAEALADVGLGAVLAPTLQDLRGPGRASWEANLDATARIAREPRWAEAGIFAAVGPHATDTVSDALFRKARDLAEELAIPAHLHLAQNFEEYERSVVEHGCSPVHRLVERQLLPSRTLFAHGIFVSDDDRARLDGERHTLAFCPHSQLRFCMPAPLLRWAEAGLPWVVATDAAACNDAMNLQAELRLVEGLGSLAASFSPEATRFAAAGGADAAGDLEAVRRRQREAADACIHPGSLLASITSRPGALHGAFRAGALAPGQQANLLLLDPRHPALWPAAAPLATITRSDLCPAITRMMVRGRWLSEPDAHRQSLLGDDHLVAVREASARLSKSLRRLA